MYARLPSSKCFTFCLPLPCPLPSPAHSGFSANAGAATSPSAMPSAKAAGARRSFEFIGYLPGGCLSKPHDRPVPSSAAGHSAQGSVQLRLLLEPFALELHQFLADVCLVAQRGLQGFLRFRPV